MTENIFDKIKNKYKSSKHPVYWDVYKHVFSGFDLTQEVNIIEIGVDKRDGMLQFK